MHAWPAACEAPGMILTCEAICQDTGLAPAACPMVELPSALAVSLQGRRASRFIAGPSSARKREVLPRPP